MPTPAVHPPTTVVNTRRRIGAPPVPVLVLALATVLGGHLWVLDAWSLPAETAAVVHATPRTVSTLAAPAPTPEPSLPVMAATTATAPAAPPAPRPREQRRPPALSAASRSTRAAEPPDTRPVVSATTAAAAAPAVAVVTVAVEADATSAQADDSAASQRLALAAVSTGSSGRSQSVAASTALTAPPSVRLLYRMTKGPLSGTGQIDWQHDASTYRMRLEARVPIFGQIFMETSEGRLDASGLAPLRHTERRIQRSERAVSFVRDQGPPRILFSAREGDEPLHPGAQDRLSWIAQLATRMSAPPTGDWRPGSRLEMDVASTGGDVQHWVFTVQGQDSAGLWQLRREPDSPRDTRADVWVDPGRRHWPVHIRLSEPSGDPLELTLEGLQPG